MKSGDKNPQGLRIQHSDKVPGGVVPLGEVARVRSPLPSTGFWWKKRPGENRGDNDKRPVQSKMLVMWSVIFTLVAFVVIGSVVWLWGRTQMRSAAATAAQQRSAPVVQKRVASRFESPSQDAAVNLVKRALQIREPGRVEKFFRAGSASPEAVVAFLRSRETVDGAITDSLCLSSMDANGLLLDGVALTSKVEGESRTRLVLLTPDDKGEWKIDFDAFARVVKPAWSEIMALSGGQGLVRVVFARDNYFNGPFRDEARWTCYRMGSPDLTDYLSGYCVKDSPQALAMQRMLAADKIPSRGGTLHRATLEIRRIEGAESRQFEITRVLAEDWVMSGTPFDEIR